jgi:hypothetical protein
VKGLKVFGWICFGLALICLLPANDFIELSWTGRYYAESAPHWLLAALVFFIAAILSWLVSRALKQIKNDLELKMLMKP